MRVSCLRNLFGGFALGKTESGQSVLVSGAIADEVVSVEIVGRKGSLLKGEVVAVLQPSPHRLVASSHGMVSNDYRFVRYDHQLQIKQDIVIDAFRRAKVVSTPTSVSVHPSPYEGHRMRCRFHANEHGRLGFFAPRSHRVTFDGLEVLLPQSRAALSRLPPLFGPVTLLENVAGDERVLWSHGELPSGLAFDSGDFQGVMHGTDGLFYCGVDGCVSDGPHSVRRSAQNFFQANRYLLPKLVAAVVGFAQHSQGPVLDLYAGGGLFSAALAREGRRVVAVENYNSDLVSNAKQFGFDAVVSSCETFLARNPKAQTAPTAIVDPARSGLSSAALASLLQCKGLSEVVHVSCDVATMARDVKQLEQHGSFRICALEAFDMFPHTPHIELVAWLSRRR